MSFDHSIRQGFGPTVLEGLDTPEGSHTHLVHICCLADGGLHVDPHGLEDVEGGIAEEFLRATVEGEYRGDGG